jgi:hypothetical protein
MIKLFSNNLLVLDKEGRQHPFSLDQLQLELEKAFQATGSREAWIPSSIAEVVQEHLYLSQQGDRPAPKFSHSDIQHLVCTILINSGFDDVAAYYGRNEESGASPQAIAQLEVSPWSQQRIVLILKRDFTDAILGGTASVLAQRIAAKIEAMGFAEVSDELIQAVAAHVLKFEPNLDALPAAQHRDWLFSAQDWRNCWEDDAARLVNSGVVAIHPVRKVVPVARLSCNLDKLAYGMAAGPMTELNFLPMLQKICPTLRQMISWVQQKVEGELPAPIQHPAHLYLHGLEKLLKQSFVPMRQTEKTALAREIEGMLASEITAKLTIPLVITLEK